MTGNTEKCCLSCFKWYLLAVKLLAINPKNNLPYQRHISFSLVGATC